MRKPLALFILVVTVIITTNTTYADNPVIKERFSADPAAIVHNDKVYLYVGHDQASPSGNFFVLKEWNIYSSTDLETWTLEGAMPRTTFNWAARDTAWASQVIERDGKFYWYVTVFNGDTEDPGFAIGVAVSDDPVHGFEDVVGGPLVSTSMTESPEFMGHEPWDDIDPSVFIDKQGQAYLYWGNTHLYYAKLKDNMVELDGEIHRVSIENMKGTFTEGPWLHEREGKYYLSFAMNYPEELGYAMSDSPEGPWEFKGKLMDPLENSNTSHPAVLEYQGEWYFIYHTSGLPTGGQYRRSVSIEKMTYNEDGTIQKIIPTASGITDSPREMKAYTDDLYVRNRIGAIKTEPLREGSYDYQWHIVSGLANDGEGYVSFQSENKQGYYIVREGSDLKLANHDGTKAYKANATFKVVEGLADETWLSFQAYDDPSLYIFQKGNDFLHLNGVTTDEQKKVATFQVEGLKASPGDNQKEVEEKDDSQANASNLIYVTVLALGVIAVIGVIRMKRNNAS